MKNLKSFASALSIGSILMSGACRDDSPAANPATEASPSPVKLLDAYKVESKGLYPEGIDYDSKNNVFVLGSAHLGTVNTLSADGKTFKTLITDSNLYSVLGVYTDEKNDRYIVVSGDIGASVKSVNGSNATAGTIAYLGIYNAQTGALIKSVNLKSLTPGAGALPNDIALDKDGNIYITDSFSPVIYKVDTNYNASIFVNNPTLFAPAPNAFGLNGIVYSEEGYLIVSKTDNNKLFKVPISNPAQATEIGGLNGTIKSPDGLEWNGDRLVVIENGLSDGKAFLLDTTDKWATANIVEQENIGKAAFPTTAVSVPNNGFYVLYSQLGVLLGGDNTKTSFEIKKSVIK